MKQSVPFIFKEIYPGSDVVRGSGFKTANTRGNCALFQKDDCFVCLTPREIEA